MKLDRHRSAGPQIARSAIWSPLVLLSGLYLAFTAYQSTTADLRLPPLLPEPYAWLTYELLRWLFPVAVLSLLGWWDQAGVLGATRWRDLPMGWIPAASALLALRDVGAIDSAQILLTLVLAILVSVYEETIFRGLVLRAALPWGALPAVAVSAVLFGLWHVGAGQPENWFVVAIGTLAGVGLGAMRLRSGTIWPAVLWHTAYNVPLYLNPTGPALGGLLADPSLEAIAKLAPALVLFAYGLVVLRSPRC